MGGTSTEQTKSNAGDVGLVASIAGMLGNLYSGYQSSSAYDVQSQIYTQMAGYYTAQGEYQKYTAEVEAAQTEAAAYLSDFNATMYELQSGLYTQMGDYNEMLGEANAIAEEINTLQNVMELRREANTTEGQQAAGYAKAGVQMEGTPTVVILDTIKQAEADVKAEMERGEYAAFAARAQGKMSGLSYDMQSMSSLASAAGSRLQADLGFESAQSLRDSTQWIDYSSSMMSWASLAQASASTMKSNTATLSAGASLLSGVGTLAMTYSKMPSGTTKTLLSN